MPKPPPVIAMLVPVARSYQAAVTIIHQQQPTHVYFLTTPQFVENVERVLGQIIIPGEYRTKTTLHNNIGQVFVDAQQVFEELKALEPQPSVLLADLTSCTTPMSLAIWEAGKRFKVVYNWVEHGENGSFIHRLTMPRR
jgi:hypothetical protein